VGFVTAKKQVISHNQQLDTTTKGFLDAVVKANPEQNDVIVSRILRWHAVGFGGQNGVLKFVASYLPNDERRQLLEEQHVKLSYTPYDWALNVV
jgi:hypothetical protein